MPSYAPNDPRRNGTATPNQMVGQNQGGIPAMPAPPPAPSIPPVAVARRKKDEIVRPVVPLQTATGGQAPGVVPISPPGVPTPGLLNVPPPPPPMGPAGMPQVPPEEGLQPEGLVAQQAPQQPPPAPEQQQAPEAGALQKTPEQQQQELDNQPSQVEGYNQGAYDRSARAAGLAPTAPSKTVKVFHKQLKEFGPHPFADDPNAPPFPMRIGSHNYNPFTGKTTSAPALGPSAFAMLGVKI